MPKLFNDVTTDVQNPPQYTKAIIGDLPEQTKKLILESYPDLKPLRFPCTDRATVFDAMLVGSYSFVSLRQNAESALAALLTSEVELIKSAKPVQAAAKEMPRWQLTHQDQVQGVLEGIATTRFLRFKDDFVFVCRQDSAGNTIVQGRSKSRIGHTDFGVNDQRIKQFFKKVEAHL